MLISQLEKAQPVSRTNDPYLALRREKKTEKKTLLRGGSRGERKSRVFSAQPCRSLFHLRAALNEINPPLTVTRDESERRKAGESSGKVLPAALPTRPG